MGRSSRARAHAITQEVVIGGNAVGYREGASPAPLDGLTLALMDPKWTPPETHWGNWEANTTYGQQTKISTWQSWPAV